MVTQSRVRHQPLSRKLARQVSIWSLDNKMQQWIEICHTQKRTGWISQSCRTFSDKSSKLKLNCIQSIWVTGQECCKHMYTKLSGSWLTISIYTLDVNDLSEVNNKPYCLSFLLNAVLLLISQQQYTIPNKNNVIISNSLWNLSNTTKDTCFMTH